MEGLSSENEDRSRGWDAGREPEPGASAGRCIAVQARAKGLEGVVTGGTLGGDFGRASPADARKALERAGRAGGQLVASSSARAIIGEGGARAQPRLHGEGARAHVRLAHIKRGPGPVSEASSAN